MIDNATPTRRLLELCQTQWCPASRRVRQQLTEVDVAYGARQVPVDRTQREELLARKRTAENADRGSVSSEPCRPRCSARKHLLFRSE